MTRRPFKKPRNLSRLVEDLQDAVAAVFSSLYELKSCERARSNARYATTLYNEALMRAGQNPRYRAKIRRAEDDLRLYRQSYRHVRCVNQPDWFDGVSRGRRRRRRK